jgi:hypothetical protein
VSIIAEFVEVSATELAALVDDPSPVFDLFEPEPAGSFAALLTPAALDRLERFSAEVVADPMSSLDPRLREELAERLGRVKDALATGQREAALRALAGSRGTVPTRPGGTSGAGTAPRRRLSLDKAWHGVHFLLTGEAEVAGSPGPLGGIVLGGIEIGEDGGYGPARYFTVEAVEQFAAALRDDRPEGDVAARYNPALMTQLGIYPGGWDAEARRWLLDVYADLRAFFLDTAANRAAAVTCLV